MALPVPSKRFSSAIVTMDDIVARLTTQTVIAGKVNQGAILSVATCLVRQTCRDHQAWTTCARLIFFQGFRYSERVYQPMPFT